jgi:O-glycosyl hydrolase
MPQVSHDQVAMLPFLKQALGRAKASGLPDMKIFGSPWSPPEWLKAPTEKDGVKGVQVTTRQ